MTTLDDVPKNQGVKGEEGEEIKGCFLPFINRAPIRKFQISAH